jgi:hypothetical protein
MHTRNRPEYNSAPVQRQSSNGALYFMLSLRSTST